MIDWLVSHGINVTAVGAAIAFVVSIFQFLSVRKRESQEREFSQYHLLIEHLVAPDEKGQSVLRSTSCDGLRASPLPPIPRVHGQNIGRTPTRVARKTGIRTPERRDNANVAPHQEVNIEDYEHARGCAPLGWFVLANAQGTAGSKRFSSSSITCVARPHRVLTASTVDEVNC
jgi:hypothetical protein